MSSLTVYRGNTAQITVTVTLNSVAVNLAGSTLKFTVKYAGTWRTDPNSAAFLQLTTTGGGVVISSPTTLGTAVATITPTMTSGLSNDQTFEYDWQLTDSLGNITTLEIGTLAIVSNVTNP